MMKRMFGSSPIREFAEERQRAFSTGRSVRRRSTHRVGFGHRSGESSSMTASSSPPSPAPPRRRATPASAPLVERPRPPAWRAPLVGALLIPLSALFGIYSYEVVQALHWTMQSLKCGPIFVLFLVMVGNLTLRRIAPRFALTHAELVLVYVMVVTATAIGGVGSVQ